MKSPDVFSCHWADLCHLMNCMFVKSMLFTLCILLLSKFSATDNSNSYKSYHFIRSYHHFIKKINFPVVLV